MPRPVGEKITGQNKLSKAGSQTDLVNLTAQNNSNFKGVILKLALLLFLSSCVAGSLKRPDRDCFEPRVPSRGDRV